METSIACGACADFHYGSMTKCAPVSIGSPRPQGSGKSAEVQVGICTTCSFGMCILHVSHALCPIADVSQTELNSVTVTDSYEGFPSL